MKRIRLGNNKLGLIGGVMRKVIILLMAVVFGMALLAPSAAATCPNPNWHPERLSKEALDEDGTPWGEIDTIQPPGRNSWFFEGVFQFISEFDRFVLWRAFYIVIISNTTGDKKDVNQHDTNFTTNPKSNGTH